MTSKLTAASVGTRAKASFPVRHLNFDFTTTSRYWFDDNPFMTHFMNAMSGVFPQGELMLIEALRKLRPQIDDPVLQAEISAFIGQEAIHAREHMAFNRYADEQAIDMETLEKRIQMLYALMQKMLPNMHIMAVGCAIEHMTATLGGELLRREDWNQRMQGPVAELWLWHSIEENEHKAVFVDAYTAAGGGYAMRVFYMALAGSLVLLLILNNWQRLLRGDGKLTPFQAAKFLWQFAGPGGLVSTRVLREFLDYFRPGFHPNDHDTKALEQQWRARMNLASA